MLTGFCSLVFHFIIFIFSYSTVSPPFIVQAVRSHLKQDGSDGDVFLGTLVIIAVDSLKPAHGKRRSSVDVDTMRIAGVLSNGSDALCME